MNRLWTAEEDAIIRADSAARVPRPVTAARLGRPVHATRNRALKLGQIIQIHVPWTAATEAALRAALTQEVPAPTDKELSVRFGRNTASIRCKIKELGLSGPRRYRRDLVVGTGRATLLAERRLAREAAQRAKVAARAARAEQKAAQKEAARVVRETRRAAKQEQAAVRARERRPAKPPAQPVVDRAASVARLREAWCKVSAARVQPMMDPAEAERRLLSMLRTR